MMPGGIPQGGFCSWPDECPTVDECALGCVVPATGLLAALYPAGSTGEEPDGLCGDRSEHRAHLVTEGSLAPFWCTADQSTREPGRSQRRTDAGSHHVCRPSRPHGWSSCQGCGKKVYREQPPSRKPRESL